MPTDLPPPGPERDAEIARLLGWLEIRIDHPIGLPAPRITRWDSPPGSAWYPAQLLIPPPFSTNVEACDRMERELLASGWGINTKSAQPRAEGLPVHEAVVANPLVRQRAFGRTRPDAVSAAALLALRGAQ